MFQATEAPSTLPSVPSFNEESPSPAARHNVEPMTILITGEGVIAYVQRVAAQGGPARKGESDPQAPVTLLPSAYIYVLPQRIIYT